MPIGWRRTADIRMAGAAATKLLAAAGRGGIALTVWPLRGWGVSAEEVAGGLACYMLVTYAVYLLAPRGRGSRTVARAVLRSGACRSHADSGEHRCRGDPRRPVDAAPVLVAGYYIGTLGDALPVPVSSAASKAA